MSIRKIALVAALGASLASAPVVAQTTTPAPMARAGATLEDANAQTMSSEAYIIGFFAIVLIGLGIYFAFDDEGDAPTSP